MRAAVIAVAILAAFAVASYAVLGVVGARETAREQRLQSCLDIENLKAAQRDRAWENFNRLDQNLKILHVKKTPKIVRIAKKQRNRELRRFPRKECP